MKIFNSSRLIFAAFLFLIFPGNTFATSGACSYHGGVNCSYGSTYYGNVMCNDGWINSSVSFYDAEECKPIVIPRCFYPTSRPTCNTSQNFSRYYYFPESSQSIKQQQEECDQKIKEYNEEFNAYYQCMRDEYGYDPGTGRVVPSKADRIAQELLEKAKQRDAELSTLGKVECIELRGPVIDYDYNTGECTCRGGYVVGKNGKCEEPPKESVACGDGFAKNIYDQCIPLKDLCSDGKIWDTYSKVCRIDNTLPVASIDQKEVARVNESKENGGPEENLNRDKNYPISQLKSDHSLKESSSSVKDAPIKIDPDSLRERNGANDELLRNADSVPVNKENWFFRLIKAIFAWD